ncbi:MAG: 2-amino-4-hydroxy-6-hydroxymethyldihydropteridine diphosphokinase, partial [Anaerolineae bacterium]
MATAYLSLGSNLGHREANIASALKMLGQEAWILKVSSLYET